MRGEFAESVQNEVTVHRRFRGDVADLLAPISERGLRQSHEREIRHLESIIACVMEE